MPKLVYIIIQLFQVGILTIFLTRYYRNLPIPYVTNEKSGFYALLAVGFLMCTIGILSNLPKISWANPFMIIAAVLGTVIIGVALVVFYRIDLLNFLNYRYAFNVVLILIIAKLAFSTWHHIFAK